MSDDIGRELDRYLADLPGRAHARLAAALADEADGLAEAISEEAPQGPTGNLKASADVLDGRDDLHKVVVAGGDLTTKAVKGGSWEYDYALGTEFGNEHVPAQPFFYPTCEARRDGIQERLQDAVGEALNE